jgi:hypothetical protein
MYGESLRGNSRPKKYNSVAESKSEELKKVSTEKINNNRIVK